MPWPTVPKLRDPKGFGASGDHGLQWIDESRPFGSGLLAYLVAEELGGENYWGLPSDFQGEMTRLKTNNETKRESTIYETCWTNVGHLKKMVVGKVLSFWDDLFSRVNGLFQEVEVVV